MSKLNSTRIALLSAAAFSALTLTAAVIAPVQAPDQMMKKSEMSGEKTEIGRAHV